MSCAPARLFDLAGGTLSHGSVADVTVFDPDLEWTVDPSQFLSKGRNSPYTGKRLKGRARYTIVEGSVVYRRESGPDTTG
jgi:dihydroorotase